MTLIVFFKYFYQVYRKVLYWHGIIGPILFNIHINDFIVFIKDVLLAYFADNSAIYQGNLK